MSNPTLISTFRLDTGKERSQLERDPNGKRDALKESGLGLESLQKRMVQRMGKE